MARRPKDQGTALESALVRAAQAAGLDARRLAEGGLADLGDLEIVGAECWIIEAKARQALSIHEALKKAVRKAGAARAALVWKKYNKEEGKSRRTTETLVAMQLDTFLYLLANQAGTQSIEFYEED